MPTGLVGLGLQGCLCGCDGGPETIDGNMECIAKARRQSELGCGRRIYAGYIYLEEGSSARACGGKSDSRCRGMFWRSDGRCGCSVRCVGRALPSNAIGSSDEDQASRNHGPRSRTRPLWEHSKYPTLPPPGTPSGSSKAAGTQ